MGRRTCLLCGTPLRTGGDSDPHFKTARHRRREKGFRRSYGAELSRKIEKLMKRWSHAR
ncbi:MAG TPA: hypothetical protein VEN81_12665 [Planctomycetota bacterium]|nr:hypothetical protein [Planctomycetota bacterium]